jgi:hypothetical protein
MKQITLTRNMIAIVDDDDFERLNKHKWSTTKSPTNKTWYAYRTIVKKGKQCNIKMHREIMEFPIGYEIDHIDHNGLNNQKSNLRIATRSQNNCNTIYKNSSGYRGVSLHCRKKNGQQKYKLIVNKYILVFLILEKKQQKLMI